MIVLDQHPSQVSMPMLGNAYCTICFNSKHRSDVSAMAQSMLLADDENELLDNLQVGEVVVRLQGRSSKPFMISVPEFAIKKGTVNDADVTHHMTRLGLLSARRHPMHAQAQPTQSVAVVVGADTFEPNAPAQLPELAFIQDVDRYPDSGVAERYKRLGLSVRQGQKLRDSLIGKELIRAEIQTIRYGKLPVIRLTAEGKLFLSEESNSRPEVA